MEPPKLWQRAPQPLAGFISMSGSFGPPSIVGKEMETEDKTEGINLVEQGGMVRCVPLPGLGWPAGC